MSGAVYVGLAGTAAASCWSDLRSGRIPNVLTFGSAAAALLVHGAGGSNGLLFSVSGLVVGLLLFLPWYVMGGMGGGDVKLLAAFGAWLGPTQVFWACLFAMLAGGALALAVMIIYRRDRPRGIAYAVPVAVGVAMALWLPLR
jgi:prepilin peptidase CpaA